VPTPVADPCPRRKPASMRETFRPGAGRAIETDHYRARALLLGTEYDWALETESEPRARFMLVPLEGRERTCEEEHEALLAATGWSGSSPRPGARTTHGAGSSPLTITASPAHSPGPRRPPGRRSS
jgi:hypothetical protein